MDHDEEIENLVKISFDVLEIDLDLLEDVPDDELYAHFETIARDATEGQLREALNMAFDDPLLDHECLVESFASSKLSTALKLRALKDS